MIMDSCKSMLLTTGYQARIMLVDVLSLMSNMKKNTCNARNDKCGIDALACFSVCLYVCLCNCEYVCKFYLGLIYAHFMHIKE